MTCQKIIEEDYKGLWGFLQLVRRLKSVLKRWVKYVKVSKPIEYNCVGK